MDSSNQQGAPREPFLATPGPSNVPEAVRRAMSGPVIHHRSVQFSQILAGVLDRAKAPFGTAQDVSILTSSGTGGMQAAVENLTRPGQEAIVASFGRFGERWAEILESFGVTVHHWQGQWGERPDPAQVAAFAVDHPAAEVLFTTHSETSTGAVSDARALAAMVREARPDMVLSIDAISSAAALRFEMDAWGWDAVVSGSQKAWMLPPGLAYVVLSDRAEERIRSLRGAAGPHPFYFDLAAALDKARSASTTPYTPAHVLIQGMAAALDLIEAEGLAERDARHRRHGRAMRAAVRALGLETFSPDDDSSAILTAISVPEGIAADDIRSHLRERAGITTAGGQAKLKGRIVRIGHCGWFTDAQLLASADALEQALGDLGHRLERGNAVAAAAAELASGASTPVGVA